MTKNEFISRVLLIMNEAGLMDNAGNSLLGADSAQADRYIEGSFVDAWRRCVKVMPKQWFKSSVFAIDSHTFFPDSANGIGYVILPDDFYLLVSFKMKGWTKPVYDAYLENEKTSSIQSNEYTRGSQMRPVCTISSKYIGALNEIRQVLNYYSLPRGISNHEAEESIYIPAARSLNELEGEDELQISDQVIEPLAYLSASTVFTLFEKYDISKSLEQRAVEMFPGLQSVRGTNVTVKQ
jgi:hypothetical protein